jgi:hypothetical protein
MIVPHYIHLDEFAMIAVYFLAATLRAPGLRKGVFLQPQRVISWLRNTGESLDDGRRCRCLE